MYKVIYSSLIILFLIPESTYLFTFQSSFTNLDMERRGNRNGPGPSRNSLARKNVDILRVLKSMMENQQKQTELLHQGLITAPKEHRPGNHILVQTRIMYTRNKKDLALRYNGSCMSSWLGAMVENYLSSPLLDMLALANNDLNDTFATLCVSRISSRW